MRIAINENLNEEPTHIEGRKLGISVADEQAAVSKAALTTFIRTVAPSFDGRQLQIVYSESTAMIVNIEGGSKDLIYSAVVNYTNVIS